MAASRTVKEGDEQYEETLKRFSGIPVALTELATNEVVEAIGGKVKFGEVYGNVLTSYMDAVEAGKVKPAVLPRAKGGKQVSVWIRSELAERFAAFVGTLEYGNESEVLSAALRWRYGVEP